MNSVTIIELQDIAAIIERFVTIWGPHKTVGIHYFLESSLSHPQKRLVFIVFDINGAGVGIGNIHCIYVGKRSLVGSATSDSPPNSVERVGEHGGVWRLNPVASSANVENEETETA